MLDPQPHRGEHPFLGFRWTWLRDRTSQRGTRQGIADPGVTAHARGLIDSRAALGTREFGPGILPAVEIRDGASDSFPIIGLGPERRNGRDAKGGHYRNDSETTRETCGINSHGGRPRTCRVTARPPNPKRSPMSSPQVDGYSPLALPSGIIEIEGRCGVHDP